MFSDWVVHNANNELPQPEQGQKSDFSLEAVAIEHTFLQLLWWLSSLVTADISIRKI